MVQLIDNAFLTFKTRRKVGDATDAIMSAGSKGQPTVRKVGEKCHLPRPRPLELVAAYV